MRSMILSTTPKSHALNDAINGIRPRLDVQEFLPRICALLVVGGLLLYVGLWLFRFYYLSFFACLLVILTFAAQGAVRFTGFAKASLPLACFFIYQTASLAWSLDLEIALEWYLINLTMPIVFIAFYAIGANSRPAGLAWFFRALMIGCFLAVLVAYQVHGSLDVEVTGALRNLIAGIMVFSFPFVIWSYSERPSAMAVPIVVAVFVLAAFLGSRAAFVLIPLVYLASMFILQSGRHRWLKRGLVMLSGVAIGLTWLTIVISDPTAVRFDNSSFSLDISAEAERELRMQHDYRVDVERRLLTYSVLEDFLENPVFGTGYMGTLILTELKYGQAIPGHGLPSLLSEYGLVGAVVFLLTIAHFWKLTAPVPGEYRSVLLASRIAMASVLGTGLVYQLVELPNFFVVYAVGVGVGLRARREKLLTTPLQRPHLDLSTRGSQT
jgi:hypothetical protein